jgi:hypothetical protein
MLQGVVCSSLVDVGQNERKRLSGKQQDVDVLVALFEWANNSIGNQDAFYE